MVDTGKIGAAPTALLRVLASGPLSPEAAMENLRLNRRQFNEAFRRLEIRAGAEAVEGEAGRQAVRLAFRAGHIQLGR